MSEIARPTSTAEVAEVLRDAATRRLTVVARGSGTKQSWGLPPTSVDLVVDLSGMDQVLATFFNWMLFGKQLPWQL